ncbi:HK97-gp10 family putative phage morphogenesis protein [Citrobacter portucalensis]|uniref:HK97-gp10 family putative phage morphogenesis protein n=1 Tax=Citrobacter portucalensis TaxID=1639133 RepID=UPI0039FC9BA2
MADGLEVKLDGLDSLLGKMSAISDVTKSKAGRFALRKAAEVIRDRARKNAQRVDDPLTREAIYKNIVARFDTKTYKQTGDIAFRVGVLGGAIATLSAKAQRKSDRRRQRLGQSSLSDMGEISGSGKGNPGGSTYYWRFLEFGTQYASAQPIIRPAMNGADMQVINAFTDEFEKSIDRAISRAQKKGEMA